jgi:hypothetical protein
VVNDKKNKNQSYLVDGGSKSGWPSGSTNGVFTKYAKISTKLGPVLQHDGHF